jgi:hypothetical protein
MRATLALAAAALLALGCGSGVAGTASERRHRIGPGLSVVLPPGWAAAPPPVTRLAYPSELLVAATYPVAREPGRESCGPTGAVRAIPPGGALIFLFEYEDPNPTQLARFPLRPGRLRLPRGPQVSFECFGVGRALTFRQRGRAFQAMVALGPRATGHARRSALALLDSLKVGA